MHSEGKGLVTRLHYYNNYYYCNVHLYYTLARRCAG